METINVFLFSELSDDAQEKALENIRNKYEYTWVDESIDSIKAFCKQFDVELTDWEIDAWHYDYKTNAKNAHFRGLKLKHLDREAMPTGYCLDNTLQYTFCDVFKNTGDALEAFNNAMDAGFRDFMNDLNYQLTDEYLRDYALCNDYKFFENGRIY